MKLTTMVPLQPFTERQAKDLDKRIRAAADKLSTASDNLMHLLEQADQAQINVALGYRSWRSWFRDAVQIQISDRFERKALVALMSGKDPKPNQRNAGQHEHRMHSTVRQP